jgi:hypothetical protein
MLTIAISSTFSTSHIALTGLISGALCERRRTALAQRSAPDLRQPRDRGADRGRGLLAAQIRDMPQLNSDGLSGFSANDWLAPTVTWVVLGVYGALRPPPEPRRYEQSRAAATVIAFAVNVLTI